MILTHIFLLRHPQVQTRRDEWTSDESNGRLGSGDDNVEVTGVGFRKQRCANVRYFSLRRLLLRWSFFIRVCKLVFDLRLLLHMGVHKSLHGELFGEDDETIVVRRLEEVRQRFISAPLPASSHGVGPVPFVLLVSACEIGSGCNANSFVVSRRLGGRLGTVQFCFGRRREYSNWYFLSNSDLSFHCHCTCGRTWLLMAT